MLLFIFLTSIVNTQTAPLIKWCIKKQNKDDGNQGLGYSQKQPFKKHVEVWLRVACLLACLRGVWGATPWPEKAYPRGRRQYEIRSPTGGGRSLPRKTPLPKP